MNGARVFIAVLAVGLLAAAGLSYFRKDTSAESHRRVRQVILHYTLSRVEQPIIVVGDSITEASTLPRSLCDHPLINAGLDGASTESDLGPWLLDVLNGRRAAAILVALGTNDALLGHGPQAFEAAYAALLAQFRTATDHLAVLGVPAVEVRGGITASRRDEAMGRIDALNAALPALAEKAGAAFVALPPMATPHTIDGVHLNRDGYAVWDAAVLEGASSACSQH
jgi:hypothetical protein